MRCLKGVLLRMAESFESVLERMGTLAYTNVGTSMMPFLRENRDVMLIRRKGAERCKRLDAVLFRRPGVDGRDAYVLHRILRVNVDGTYWIVGDNCASGETVPDERVLGILCGIVRDGKFVRADDARYRFFVHLWCDFWPIRFALLRLRARVGRLLRRR